MKWIAQHQPEAEREPQPVLQVGLPPRPPEQERLALEQAEREIQKAEADQRERDRREARQAQRTRRPWSSPWEPPGAARTPAGSRPCVPDRPRALASLGLPARRLLVAKGRPKGRRGGPQAR